MSFSRYALLAALARIVLIAGPAAQQSPRPEFEVVSIKASPRIGSGAVAFFRDSTPGTVTLTGITPKNLIARAYSLKPYQISGPAWLDDELYDIVAKAAGPVADSEQRSMLQSMLASRFQLAAHTETRVLPAYELVAGKSGPKIHAVRPDDTGNRVYPGRPGILAKQVSMPRLAELLSAKIDRPVLDKTGLSGVFDIDLKFTPDTAAPDADTGPSVFTAVQDQLGLKLNARKSPVEILVIDHAAKPSGN